MERIGVFIDGSNLYYAVKNSFGNLKIDYEYFIHSLCGGRRLIRAYYYITPVPEEKNIEDSRKQRSFLNYLKRVPYLQLQLGRLKRSNSKCNLCGGSPETWVEKGVDVNLAIDMVRMAYQNNFDTAILVSADSDYAAAVRMVKDFGKHVELAHPDYKSAKTLNDECDKFIEITKSMLVKPIVL